MAQDTELAWLAGFFDGEGSIAIQIQLPDARKRHPVIAPRMGIKIKYGTHVLGLYQARFGGKLYSSRNGCDYWHLMGRESLREALTAIRPHLRVKDGIADRFLTVLDLMPDLKGVRRCCGERAWTPDTERRVMQIALSLNPPDAKNAKQKAHAERVRRYLETVQ
jgi:hypothetical protein